MIPNIQSIIKKFLITTETKTILLSWEGKIEINKSQSMTLIRMKQNVDFSLNFLNLYLTHYIFNSKPYFLIVVNITKIKKILKRKMDRMFPMNPNPMTEPYSTVNRDLELKEG